MITFEGSIAVPGAPAAVLQRLTDIERVARCMPGAEIAGRNADGTYLGVMNVAFGPKKLKFKGNVKCTFDFESLSGELVGTGAAAMNAARIHVKTLFKVLPETGDAARSRISITSEAKLSGALASLGQSAADSLANALMQEFEKNLVFDLTNDAAIRPDMREPEAISGSKVLWAALGRGGF